MRIALVNLSNEVFEASRELLNQSAVKNGVSEIFSWDFEDLKKTAFYRKNQEFLNHKKGLGYWAWKPFIMMDALSKLDDDDILVYADCGHEIISSLQPLVDLIPLESSVMLFKNGDLDNASWTKRDCFIKMDCDSKSYWYGPQVDASFIVVRKHARAIELLKQWQYYCLDKHANTSNPNELGRRNLPSFIEHRWDQSILSLLAIKNCIELFRMPSQFGNHYKLPAFRVDSEINCRNQYKPKQLNYYATVPDSNSPYFQLLNHHRSKRTEVKSAESTVTQICRLVFGYPLRFAKRLEVYIHRKISR